MTGLKVPCLVAMYILACGANTMEPEPEGFTTSMEPEPGQPTTMASPTPAPTMPASTTVAAGNSNNTATTAAAQTIKHIVSVSVAIDDFSKIKNFSALTSSLKAGVEAANQGADVVVKVNAIHVESQMDGFPDGELDYDSIIDAIADLSPTLTREHVLVNGVNHSTFRGGGRRLLQSVTVTTIVEVNPDDTTTDYVALANQIAEAHKNTTAVEEALKKQNSTAFSSISIQITKEPYMTVAVTTEIKGTMTEIDTDALKEKIGSEVGGNVTVTATSQEVVVATTTVGGNSFEQDNGASLAPMMIVWAFVYAFLMK